MAAAFKDLPVVDHQHLICFPDGGEAVRDDEAGAAVY
jgi:hypothetical protein